MKGVRVKIRAAASVLVAGALITGLAACDAVTPQWTTHSYAPSDGVNGQAGPIDIRNAFLVTDGGPRASLVVGFVNSSDVPKSVQVQYTSAGTPTTTSVTVPASGILAVGPGREQTVTLSGVRAKPGALFPLYVSTGGQGTQLAVPVLNNTLPGYRTLLPPAPTPTLTPSPGTSGTPSPSPLPK